ncbi:lipase family protein [Nocardia sp. NBC_00565]|uniref:alpha/beta fold hydrolase n=1 Tax=Nocardia sp. NBC_00565 TaxID=2975993 RepID=UPI002E807C12|nr:alpha/beta fold hydrolase [Nocardia sp. NBC_00565]WUC00088.1 lipase family protein [Nocardia sp. NBC_00565]
MGTPKSQEGSEIVRIRIFGLAAALTGTLIVVVGGTIAAPHAWTQPAGEKSVAEAGDFYLPPPSLPDGRGTIVRAEPAQVAMGMVPAAATRLMYVSSDTHDAPTAVVGTYLQPNVQWTGPGERPLVAYAGGTKGQGDQCAPSKLMSQVVQVQPPLDIIFEYDLVAISSLLSRGIAVVVTDYHGLGTPDVHDYLNRKAQAHAVLDSARAALQLPGTGLNPGTPVILYGYSQGGMASAGAAELQSSYAPEVNVRGAYVGGPVVDDEYFIGYNDGRADIAPAFAWILNGIAADYPETRPVLDAELNDIGKAILGEAQGKCAVPSGLAQQHRLTSEWTTSGEPLTAVIDRSPALKSAFAEQRIGTLTPAVPVLAASATNDEGAPFVPVREMAAGWCGSGVPVQLESNAEIPPVSGLVGTHVMAFFPSLAASQQWLTDRLAGMPAPSNCAALP